MFSVVVVVAVVVSVSVMTTAKEHLFGVVPAHVGEDTVLNVAAEETFFGEGTSEFFGVDSPAHIATEEEWLFGFDS